MKPLIASFILFLFGYNIMAQFSREQAIEIIATEVVGIEMLESHHLFSKIEKLFLNDTLWLEYFEYRICPMDTAWVFFVDDMPIVHWAHPCRIIWFNISNGEYQILDEQWPPLEYLNNHSLFLENWDWVLFLSAQNNTAASKTNFSAYPNPFQNNLQFSHQTQTRDFVKYHCLISRVKRLSQKPEF